VRRVPTQVNNRRPAVPEIIIPRSLSDSPYHAKFATQKKKMTVRGSMRIPSPPPTTAGAAGSHQTVAAEASQRQRLGAGNTADFSGNKTLRIFCDSLL
jgi:hypothetical protein